MVHSRFIFSAAIALSLVGAASAADLFDNFEGGAPAGFTRTTGQQAGQPTTRFSVAGEPARDSRSVRFEMNDVDNEFSRTTFISTAGAIGKLRDFSASFETYVDPTSDVALTPYFLVGLDSNFNGVYDSATDALVIQFSSQITGNLGSVPTGVWLNEGLNGTNDVHVQVDRGALPAGDPGNFQPDATPDKLSTLYDLNYDATTKWGDLNVFQVRIAAGFFAAGTGNQDYLAYVDNVRASAQPVPEPATMAALGLGAAALLRRRRAKRA